MKRQTDNKAPSSTLKTSHYLNPTDPWGSLTGVSENPQMNADPGGHIEAPFSTIISKKTALVALKLPLLKGNPSCSFWNWSC